MQSQQFYVHYVLVKKCSLKPFLNFDNESAHIRESGNEFHLSIYLCQKENFKILVLEKDFQIFLLFLDLVLAREKDKYLSSLTLEKPLINLNN